MNRKQRRVAEKSRQRVATARSRAKATSGALHGKMPAVNTRGKTIGLCMIVKNESKVILRCLESVRPIVDYILIEDTGSTDGTQALIREWLERVGLPGEVYDEPWQDFAYNRSHALARLRKQKGIDYALVLDADDSMVFDNGFDAAAFKKTLTRNLHDVELRHGGIRYRRPQICSNSLNFRYRGVLHEFLQEPPGAISRGATAGFYITSTREGARSQDPEKYRKDAAILENALRSEKDPFLRSRYTFYLARSYEHAGENEKALDNFLKRAELGYWPEEVFMSLYSAGHRQQALGRPVDEVIATFLRASNAAPSRAEGLHAASRCCRENNKFAEGYEYARRGLAIPLPASGLFVVSWIYEYGLLDEFAVNAYWLGRYDDCLGTCERLLREGKIPAEMRERIEQNARFAREKLASQRLDVRKENVKSEFAPDSQEVAPTPIGVDAAASVVSNNADLAQDKLASRVQMTPEKVSTIGGTSQVSESESERPRLKVILVCGPFGSGTSVVTGLLDRMGVLGLGPYFETDDPKTENTYESVEFREIIRNALGYPSQPGLPFTAPVTGAVQSGLRSLQTRIVQQEFGPFDLRSPKLIFLKYPMSAFVIPQICEVFDTKLIYVMRPLEDIERTRLRRNWPPYYGSEGAALIYEQMSAIQKHHSHQIMNIDYKDLLTSPMVQASNIAVFAGLDLCPAELQNAVDFVRKPDAMPSAINEMRRE